MAQFLEDFTGYVDSHTTTSGKLVIVGDFNFWYGEDDNQNACRFSTTLTFLGLHQSVREHTQGKHALDLIVTCANEKDLIRAFKVSPIWFSDHFYISFRMPIKKPRCQKKILRIRNLKNINMEEVAVDITQSILFTNTPTDLDDLVHCYSTTLSQTLYKHPPATTKEVIVRPHTPWFSEGIKTAKQESRRAERKWYKSKSTVDRDALKEKQRAFNDLCQMARKEFYSNAVNSTIFTGIWKTPPNHKTNNFLKNKFNTANYLGQDIISSDLIIESSDVDCLVASYYRVLSELLDRHVPVKFLSVSQCNLQPWINDEILNANRNRRRQQNPMEKVQDCSA